jgi:hypothetical protein
MKIDENFFLGVPNDRRNYSSVYSGLLLPDLQPVVCLSFSNKKTLTFFLQFGNDRFYTRAWAFEQASRENIVNLKEIRHRVFNNDQTMFMLDYEGLDELSIDSLLNLSKGTDRYSFVLDYDNFVKVIKTIHTINTKYSTRTSQFSQNINLKNSSHIFSVSIYSLDTIVANLKSKKIDGFGVAVEVFDKTMSDKYGVPIIVFGSYLVFSNNYEDLFFRDCVPILSQNNVNCGYIKEFLIRFSKNYRKDSENIKAQAPSDDDLIMFDDEGSPTKPKKVPQEYEAIASKTYATTLGISIKPKPKKFSQLVAKVTGADFPFEDEDDYVSPPAENTDFCIQIQKSYEEQLKDAVARHKVNLAAWQPNDMSVIDDWGTAVQKKLGVKPKISEVAAAEIEETLVQKVAVPDVPSEKGHCSYCGTVSLDCDCKDSVAAREINIESPDYCFLGVEKLKNKLNANSNSKPAQLEPESDMHIENSADFVVKKSKSESTYVPFKKGEEFKKAKSRISTIKVSTPKNDVHEQVAKVRGDIYGQMGKECSMKYYNADNDTYTFGDSPSSTLVASHNVVESDNEASATSGIKIPEQSIPIDYGEINSFNNESFSTVELVENPWKKKDLEHRDEYDVVDADFKDDPSEWAESPKAKEVIQDGIKKIPTTKKKAAAVSLKNNYKKHVGY